MTNREKKQEHSNRMNSYKAARKKLKSFRKEQGIPWHGVKDKEVIYQYALYLGREDELTCGRVSCREWLIDLFRSGEDNLIRRSESCFYRTSEWLSLRKKVLKMYGLICMKCKATEFIHVDHIYPRSLYPHLELEFDNMQVLCRSCNCSKSNRRIIDYRENNI